MTWRFRIRVAWSVLRGSRHWLDPYLLGTAIIAGAHLSRLVA